VRAASVAGNCRHRRAWTKAGLYHRPNVRRTADLAGTLVVAVNNLRSIAIWPISRSPGAIAVALIIKLMATADRQRHSLALSVESLCSL